MLSVYFRLMNVKYIYSENYYIKPKSSIFYYVIFWRKWRLMKSKIYYWVYKDRDNKKPKYKLLKSDVIRVLVYAIGFKMCNYLMISFLVLWISFSLASLSSKELLECQENLTAAIKNDTTFLKKVRQSDYIFTGKVKELRHGQLLYASVKRAIKGVLNTTVDLTVNDTCSQYIRRGYTGIFMARCGTSDVRHVNKIVMHFGPVPLTLINLDRLNAAVKGEFMPHGNF